MDRLLGKKNENPNIVVVGGGTGLSVLLRGLKEHTDNITAIVTVADDGGSSGRLRQDLGILPPGDIRSCLIALANTEPTMEKLLQYRFTEGTLKGQSFGNLFIAAMNEIYGNFEMAIKETSNVLSITGKVLPVTLDNVSLIAHLDDGSTVEGESKIPEVVRERKARIDRITMKPEMSYPLKESLKSITDADLIVLGPGSLYTSIVPNLLVRNMVEYIDRAKAPVVLICNIMTQPGETDNYTVTDHLHGIIKHSHEGFVDYVVANVEKVPANARKRYEKDGATPVTPQKGEAKELKKRKIKLIEEKLIEVEGDYVRHDTKLLSEILMDLV